MPAPHTIDDLFALAKPMTDAVSGAIAIVNGAQAAIIDKTTLSDKDQATVEAIFQSITDNIGALIAAAHHGTPTQDATDAPAVAEFEAAPVEPLVPGT